ncbi:MAG: diguanylate cyclase [Nitrospinae bacterium]|nr:diguanylate cyclase [Nitrospinota bacterium]
MGEKTILIVDDEEDIRINLETALNAEGYKTVLAGSGEEALRLAQSSRPDVLLLDIMMPDMDGYELCKKLKADGSAKGAMIVFASALRKTQNKVAGLDMGADDYVTKPFNMPELLAKLRALFRAKEHNRQLEQLVNFSRSVNALEISAIAGSVRLWVPQILGAERFSVFTIDWEESAFRLLAHNHGDGEMDDLSVPMAASPLMLEAVKSAKEIAFTDFPSSKYSAGGRTRAKYADGHAVCSPVELGTEVFGVLNLNGNASGFFDRLDLNRVRLVCETLAGSLGNHMRHEQMNKLAITDGLTKLFNHRYFQERLAQEFERAKRFSQDLSLILMDIDFFKRVNDTYGHPVGDAILKAVATRISAHLRKIDLTARYGGEEFAILLPQTNVEMALAVAERIREDMAAKPVETDKGDLTVTISLGVCDTSVNGVTGGADLVKKADEALYAAKKDGRNRVKSAI